MGKMEKKGKNGLVRSPIWGLFYKKHKKNSFFLKKNAQKLASFEKYTYICNMKISRLEIFQRTIRTEW